MMRRFLDQFDHQPFFLPSRLCSQLRWSWVIHSRSSFRSSTQRLHRQFLGTPQGALRHWRRSKWWLFEGKVIYIYICVYIYIYIYIYVYIYIYIYVCVYICVYVYIHLYSYWYSCLYLDLYYSIIIFILISAFIVFINLSIYSFTYSLMYLSYMGWNLDGMGIQKKPVYSV